MGEMRRLSAEDLFARAALTPFGPIAWGTALPTIDSGVYVICTGDHNIDISGFTEDLRTRWVPGQSIVYIGRAKVLRNRLQQFYRHKFGAKSPHRGGQSILQLNVHLQVYWSVADDYAAAEHRLIEGFRSECGVIPFGNRIKSARLNPLP